MKLIEYRRIAITITKKIPELLRQWDVQATIPSVQRNSVSFAHESVTESAAASLAAFVAAQNFVAAAASFSIATC